MFGFLKRKKKENVPPPASSPAGTVHADTVIYTMPAKFLVPEAPPFWTWGKAWLIVAVLMVGLVGVVYWLLVSANPPAANPPSSKSEVVQPPTSSEPPPTSPPPSPAPEEPLLPGPSEPTEPIIPPPAEPAPIEPAPEPMPPAAPLPSSLDSDQDDLTDVEEALYGTASAKPDTDGDGFADAEELFNGYNPKGPGRLADAGLFKTYTESTSGEQPQERYTVLYPAAWVAEALAGEVQFVASPEEFISVSVQPNPNSLSLQDWYAGVSPGVDTTALNTETFGPHSGIFSSDRRTFYFISPLRTEDVFVVNYNVGTKTETNFATTFAVIIRGLMVKP